MNNVQQVEDFLSHHGIKGQRWGIRNDRIPGVSRRVHKIAGKDAKEHARAKLFYGEGAGTRRKLINAKVEYNRKNVPGYSKAFDAHASAQNLSDHSNKAIKERDSIDRRNRNKKRAGAIARRLTGEWGTQAAFVALAATGAAFAQSPKGRQFLNSGVSKVKSAQSNFVRKQGAKRVSDMLKKMG